MEQKIPHPIAEDGDKIIQDFQVKGSGRYQYARLQSGRYGHRRSIGHWGGETHQQYERQIQKRELLDRWSQFESELSALEAKFRELEAATIEVCALASS